MCEVSQDVQIAFDRYINLCGFHCLESYRGLRALETVIADLTQYGGLHDMLLDNSDLVYLIFDYVKELSVHDSEVREKIMQYADNDVDSATDTDSDSEDNE